MSKAILVMDMPSSCDVCDFVQIDDMVGNMTCMNPTSEVYECDVSDYVGCRANVCPLREEPKKKNDNPLASDTMYKYAYAQGYNACIDEILGDKE